MTQFSDDFKINVNKLNADEAVLICLEINHPFLLDTLRVVNDSVKLISNGETYLPMGFDFKRQDDIEGELPKCTLSFSNVGRILTTWIDSSGGGRDATIDILLIRRSDPDTVEERIQFSIENTTVTTETVSLNLIIQNNLIKRAINYFFDKQRAPGLF